MKWGLSFGVMLYQIGAELVEPMAGIEPATDGLRNRCSTTELHWLFSKQNLIAAKNHYQKACKRSNN
jgi:hypothetical protein